MNDYLVCTRHTQQVRDDFSGSIVVPIDPDDLDFVRELAECGKYSPVLFLEPSEIDRVKHIAIQDQSFRGHRAAPNRFQEMDQVFCLAIRAAEVNVGDYDSIVHSKPHWAGAKKETSFSL